MAVSRPGWWPLSGWPRRTSAPSPRVRGYDDLVEELSQKLYRGTLREGGWSVDAGVLTPAHFRSDAQRMIHEILLGGAQGDLPSP
jgi:hypothetical protein